MSADLQKLTTDKDTGPARRAPRALVLILALGACAASTPRSWTPAPMPEYPPAVSPPSPGPRPTMDDPQVRPLPPDAGEGR